MILIGLLLNVMPFVIILGNSLFLSKFNLLKIILGGCISWNSYLKDDDDSEIFLFIFNFMKNNI